MTDRPTDEETPERAAAADRDQSDSEYGGWMARARKRATRLAAQGVDVSAFDQDQGCGEAPSAALPGGDASCRGYISTDGLQHHGFDPVLIK